MVSDLTIITEEVTEVATIEGVIATTVAHITEIITIIQESHGSQDHMEENHGSQDPNHTIMTIGMVAIDHKVSAMVGNIVPEAS